MRFIGQFAMASAAIPVDIVSQPLPHLSRHIKTRFIYYTMLEQTTRIKQNHENDSIYRFSVFFYSFEEIGAPSRASLCHDWQ